METRPTLYIAITNHGFGHATRTATLAGKIQQLCPDILLIMATTAPRWLLELYIEGDFICLLFYVFNNINSVLHHNNIASSYPSNEKQK